MSVGNLSGVSWAFKVLTLDPAVLISTQRGGRALGTGVPSVVKEISSDECIKACCHLGGVKGANFGWV